MWAVAAAAVFLLASASLSLTAGPPRGTAGHSGKVPPGLAKKSRAVPVPLAGVGLPLLFAAGGCVWYVNRRRRQADADDAGE